MQIEQSHISGRISKMMRFADIQRDELLCMSTGKPVKQSQASRLDIEIKVNWSRAHKQYGVTATEVQVEAPVNPKVNILDSLSGGLFEKSSTLCQ